MGRERERERESGRESREGTFSNKLNEYKFNNLRIINKIKNINLK